MSAPEPHQGGVSTREAAAILGTSPSDVLRRIRAGELRAERFERKGGTYFRVYLDPLQDAPGAPPEPEPPRETGVTPEPLQDAPASTTWLQDRLVERDETIAGLYVELRALAERAARAEAALDGANARAEQGAIDYGEQMERAIKAEAHATRERERADDLATRLEAAERERDRLRARSRWKWWTW